MENDQKSTARASTLPPTPGMIQIQNAVEFTHEKTLQPEVKPMTGSSKLLVDQATGMMIQDARSFLQGSEQVITVAMAKAIALTLDPATQEAGQRALESLEKLLTTLPTFASAIGTAASAISKEYQ